MSNIHKVSLREELHPMIRELANIIENAWETHLDLQHYQIPTDLGYIEGKLEGEKLTIENLCYQTPQFRKLHLELAKVGQNLDILHCVMFPRVDYALPMFGTDIVGGRGQVSAAIADLSPLNATRVLPESYRQELGQLNLKQFSQPRDLPEWGNIFSEFCLFIRPGDEAEESKFLAIVKSFLDVHCQRAIALSPASEKEQAEIYEAQLYYCNQQRQNDKTRRVLEKAFGDAWAETYMQNMLFNNP